ncbi:MAG: gas vesicle protein K [Terrabacter sp.]
MTGLPWENPAAWGAPGEPGPSPDVRLPPMLLPQRLETDSDAVARDLLKLVLTIIELIRQLMEKQALRRVEEGDLSDEQVEGLGLGLMHLEEAMDELKERYGLTTDDLNLDLGPLGKLL